MTAACPFCSLPSDRVLLEREAAFAIRDGFPVSPGHALIIPRRHVPPLRMRLELRLREKARSWVS